MNSQDIIIDVDQDAQNGSWPEGVTEEPRSDEEMHLGTIKNKPALLKAYLPVSDDAGDMLGDKELEKEVVECCKRLATLRLKNIDDPEALLQELKDLSIRYVRRINTAEHISIGTATKYRIREGMLFNQQKRIVKKKLGQNWTVWFKDNHDKSLLRSVQDYMRLAKVPNIIPYAWLGKEQLLEVLKRIGEIEGDDPIGEFLTDNGIDFSPEAELDINELKIKTDVAINHQKLVEEGLDAIPVGKVESFVRNGKEIKKEHIRDLKLLKEGDGNFLRHMDKLISTDGKEKLPMSPDSKAESYKKAIARFIDQTISALDDAEYLEALDRELYRRLKAKVLELEQKLPDSSDS